MSSNSTVLAVIAEGGNDTDVTFLPSCSSAVSYSDYSLTDAADFDPRDWDYYKDLIPYAIGGWVAAGICLVLAAIFTIWLFTLYACSCCCGVRRHSQRDHAAAQAFKGSNGAYAGDSRYKQFKRRHSACSIVLCSLIVVCLILVAATASWGLAEGLLATRRVSDQFWDTIASARLKVTDIRDSVGGFIDGVGGLQSTLQALAGVLQGANLDNLQRSLDLPLNLTGLASSDVSGALNDIADGLSSILTTGGNITGRIQQYGVTSLANLEKNNRGIVDDVQDKYAPAVLGVLFGVLMLLAILATVLLLLRRVRCGGLFLALLWFWTALWFFAGPGLLHFGERFTSDACLYPETFAFRYVNETSLAPDTKAQIATGLSYYFGVFGNDTTLDQVINDIYNLDLSSVSAIANSSVINQTVDYLSTEAAQAILQADIGLSATQRQAFNDAPAALGSVVQNFNTLEQQMSRDNFEGLYSDLKGLLCCTLANRVRSAWIAWTVAATFAGLLCILLTIRAFQASRDYSSKPPASDQFIVAGAGAGAGGLAATNGYNSDYGSGPIYPTSNSNGGGFSEIGLGPYPQNGSNSGSPINNHPPSDAYPYTGYPPQGSYGSGGYPQQPGNGYGRYQEGV